VLQNLSLWVETDEMEEQSYRLIVEYFEKTISDEGLTQLQEWIEESPEHLEQFSETIEILEASRVYFRNRDNAIQTWARVQAHIDQEEKPVIHAKRKIRWLAYAAVALLMSTFSLVFYFHKTTVPVDYAELSNPNGQHSRILLPDSSVVYLSGGSKIRYEKTFLGTKRMVYLDGEAFFDVVHQSRRPFVVKSGEITTVVLGTSFNVKAYASENKVDVTVRTGKVGVMASVAGKTQLVRYLLPDEQLKINTDNGLYTFNKADAREVSGWINNHFVFYNTPLKEIAVSLEHRYGVKIEFTDPELGESRLTAKFKNLPLKQVMEDLTTLSGLSFTQKDNHVFISNNDQKGGKIMK